MSDPRRLREEELHVALTIPVDEEDIAAVHGHIAALEAETEQHIADKVAALAAIVTEQEKEHAVEQAEIARLRSVLGRIADPPACSAGCDAIARKALGLLDDGFGNVWQKCEKADCELEIVRPGTVQCNKCDYPNAAQATP